MILLQKYRPFFLFLLAVLFFGSFLASMAFNVFWKEIRIVNEPLHSSFEAFGAMAALSMALLLLQLHKDGNRKQAEYVLLAIGFLMMGVLDTFHACSSLGRGSLLMRSFASICGSIWFALVWIPGVGRYCAKMRSIPAVIIPFSFLAGLFILWYRELFPLMMQDERFTPFAVVIHVTSGVLLMAAAVYFFLEFLRSSTIEAYLFTCMFLLSGLPALQFSYSAMWSEDWWFWHVQRYLSSIIVFFFMFRTFLVVRDKLERMNENLEQLVVERTEALSVEIAERKRYGAERDQVIHELQDAMAQIKTLTGLLPTCASCKRIKDQEGRWIQMESYIQDHSGARFTHGLCPDCIRTLYPDIYEEILRGEQPPPAKP